MLGYLIHAQEEDRPATDIVGSHLSDLLAAIEDAHGNRRRIGFHLFNGLQYFIFLMFVSQAAIFGIRGSAGFLETPIGFRQIPFGILIAFSLIPLMRYAVARQKTVIMVALPLGFVGLYLAIHRIMRGSIADSTWVQYYLDTEVSFVSTWVEAFLWLTLFVAASGGRWLLRRHALRQFRST